MPFPRGVCQYRNHGGRPFIKIAQRLSVVTADSLSERASDEDCIEVGLAPGATKAKCVVEACYRAAIAGDVAAARALFEFTEAAKIRVEQFNVNFSVFARARDRLLDVMAGRGELPEEVQT
jgi:hypothetical protein